MKTIYLKAEIEDDTPTDQAVICLNDYDWSEVYLPTEEEIIKIIDAHLRLNHDDTPYCGRNAAKMIINKIKEQ